MPDECNATGYVVPFAGFTYSSPVVPEIFWNVYNAEQRYLYLCQALEKLVAYSDTLAVEINSLNERVSAIENTYTDTLPKLDERVSDLEKALETIVTSMLVYDPTKGAYTASIDQSRRVMQILATPADDNLTVQTLADSGRTVNDWATTMCGEMVNSSFKRMAGKYMPYQEV